MPVVACFAGAAWLDDGAEAPPEPVAQAYTFSGGSVTPAEVLIEQFLTC